MRHILPLTLTLALSVMLFVGCMGQGIKIQGADEALAEGKTDKALELYLAALTAEPEGKYANHSHYQVAEIYKNRDMWEQAIQHYQAIIGRTTTGYLASRARSRMADIRKLRQVIDQQKQVWENRTDSKQSQTHAASALLAIGDAYNTLGNYEEAVKWYKTFVQEYPEHELAAQTQFKIGNVYFYEIYDYEAGWPEYVKLIEDERFKGTYESKEAAELLKKVKLALESINQDMEYIAKYRREKAIDFEQRGRKVTQAAKYSVYAEQIAQTYKSIARTWENNPLRNYPNAIKVYQELADELPQEKSAAAEALYRVGELQQQDGNYEAALVAYDQLFEKAPESSWRDNAVYNQALCYEAIREFTKAYNRYKDYMSLGEDKDFYRPAEQKVRQFEYDQDGDGHPFYKEQEAGTSDRDPNAYPGSQQMAQAK